MGTRLSADNQLAEVLVVGAGVMGIGITQIAAQAGHPLMLFDLKPGAAELAREQLAATLGKLVDKGKIADDLARQTLQRIRVIDNLADASGCALVVEAIVENLEAKRELFKQLESLVDSRCILASNTSSLSITAIARDLRHPDRVVGMHFFNPVPLMKLVEVVSGLQTSASSADRIFALAETWGKSAVHARSTPGFIVNRIARPFYAEALALLQERSVTPAALDACLRGAGFRMGPCELMDLIGHDTNFSVTRSVYEANYFDKRFTPSLVQRELVDGGMLGRKSGRGFYDYDTAVKPEAAELAPPKTPPVSENLAVHGAGPVAERIADALRRRDCDFEIIGESEWIGLRVDNAQLRLTDGRCASALGRDLAVFDLPLNGAAGGALAWSHASGASARWIKDTPDWLAFIGFTPQRIEDTPGLVVARTIAMLINEAADAVQQGVCSEDGANDAMKLGVNYPAGPFEWLADWDTRAVISLLDRLDDFYRGERYRVSPWLRHRAWREEF